MAGRGPAPKPAHLRQRTNKKVGVAVLAVDGGLSAAVPDIPNPDGRVWHELTTSWWGRVWTSAMSGQYLPTDVDGLGRVAILVDEFYRKPNKDTLAEIRLQESRFGLSPLDRSRLQWEIQRGEEAEKKRTPPAPAVKSGGDLRKMIRMVNG
jgi:hypothetical protein